MLPLLPTIAGSNLRAARERHGLSRAQLGQIVGRTERSVARWESGSATPRPTERIALARALDVEDDAIFPEVEPAVVTAARRVVEARTVPDLRRAVARLGAELASLDKEDA